MPLLCVQMYQAINRPRRISVGRLEKLVSFNEKPYLNALMLVS